LKAGRTSGPFPEDAVEPEFGASWPPPWFSANKLIMEDVAYTPSKQVMSNGYPLYWNCRITLTPYKTITIGEFEAYFQSVNTMSPDQVAAVKKEDPNFFERFVAKTNDAVKKVTG
jgi:hypothetical protein